MMNNLFRIISMINYIKNYNNFNKATKKKMHCLIYFRSKINNLKKN